MKPLTKEEFMRHSIALGLTVLCTVSVLAAQAPDRESAVPRDPAQQQPTQKPTTPPAAAAQADASKVTYTGCLKPGTAADTWILENAEVASAAGAKSPAATAGTSGTASSKMTLGVTAKPTDNLKPHANHKIEVVGTLSPNRSAAGAAGATPSPSASTTPTQNITIESFKMVSATCP